MYRSKKKISKEKGKGLVFGKNSQLKKPTPSKHTIVQPKLHKTIPISNHDLLDWCKYLEIPIKNVLSRDQIVPRNYNQVLFI